MTRDARVLRDVPLAIDPDEVLRFQGYRRDAGVAPADVLALFDRALSLGRSLIEPRAVVRWTRVHRQDGDRIETDALTLAIPRIGALWGPIDRLAAAVCTIGDGLERRVRELWDARDLPLAMMLDSVGSAAVESLAEFVNDVLCQEAVPGGLRVTNRVSPGYGDWDVSAQRDVLRLVPAEDVGVTLNEACFMTPVKSISLVAGAGPAARVDQYFSQCARCWMRDCAYRRAPVRRSVHR